LTVFLRELLAVCAVNMNIWIHYKFTFITVRDNEITRRIFGEKEQFRPKDVELALFAPRQKVLEMQPVQD
jgi:hypothetical protein